MKNYNPNKNVYQATMERIEFIFNEFKNVLIAFSTGKDSGTMLHLAYKYAKENNLLHKLAIYYQDYEAIYHESTLFTERVFNEDFKDVKRKYWLCMPVKASCSVTMMQDGWIPWNKDEREIWVRGFPKSECLYNEDNYPYPFIKGTKGFDFRIDFSTYFAKEYGKTAVLVGLRADESLSRLAIFTRGDRVKLYKNKQYGTYIDENTYAFYPIYDWRTDDIWIANSKFRFDYNRVYDLYYLAGLSIHEMRIASPFHSSGQGHLRLYKQIDPNNWAKMLSRVNGVNFTGIYGGTTAMGWKSIKKPVHFTWKQYANFLLTTLPEEIHNRYITKIKKSQWHWQEQGGARTPEFIEQMKKEGVKMRITNKQSPSVKVHTHKRLIYIDEMMDDTDVEEFKKAPSWKRVCVTILKNDLTCQYMGFSRTKAQMDKRKEAIKKYKEIL